MGLWSRPPTARMQYTATSFAEPLQRVFDDVLAPEANVDVTAHAESRYVLERIRIANRCRIGSNTGSTAR